MSQELDRVAAMGWDPPPVDSEGVRTVAARHGDISYPVGALATLAGEGGSGFWLDARADAVGQLLQRAGVRQLWDVGAGSGAMAKRLPPWGIDVVSVEPLPDGARQIAAMGAPVLCSTLQELALPTGSLRAVGMFDVVEHLEHPEELLAEVRRVLEPGGWLAVTVPAYQWLWSEEDVVLGHHRRYSTRSLTEQLTATGFTVAAARYAFASLVPLAAVLRTLPYRLGRRRSSEELLTKSASRIAPPPAADRAARQVLHLETLVARGLPLPFGLSVVALARSLA